MAQLRNAGGTTALVTELGKRFKAGQLSDREFTAVFVAAERLGHDAAVRLMRQFIADYRKAQTPSERHADPVLDVFDPGASFGRASGLVEDLGKLDRTQADFDAEFFRLVGNMAVRAAREALNGGRRTMQWSTAANCTRWRRVTDSNPCSFCAMLATRSDYRTEASAGVVVGRARGYSTASYKATGEVSHGGTNARGKRAGRDRRRGTRAPGEQYHDYCGCTVVEVVGDWQATDAEQEMSDLYRRATEACARADIPKSAPNVLAKMRELGEGVIHDAHVPQS